MNPAADGTIIDPVSPIGEMADLSEVRDQSAGHRSGHRSGHESRNLFGSSLFSAPNSVIFPDIYADI